MSHQRRYIQFGGKTLEKPPIGVVKDAGKPQGFRSEHDDSITAECDWRTTNFGSENIIVFTAQPSVLLDATPENTPDWYTLCIVTPAAKRKILSTPGYPQPLNRPPLTRHKIMESPTSGIGMFATVDMELGDLVFSERALLMASPAITKPAYLPAHYTQDQAIQAALYEKERVLEQGFNTMSKESQDAYMKLHNCHLYDGSGPLLGIMRTNSFSMEYFYDERYLFPYAGVFKDASRMNHSCCPNVRRFVNPRTFGIEFRALHSIKKGEEILTSYVVIEETTAERQDELAPYEFQCQCRVCQNPQKSDQLRSMLRETPPCKLVGQRLVLWLMTPGLPESYVVEPCLERLGKMEEGGLESTKWYEETLEYLVELYCSMGNAAEAVKSQRKLELIRVEFWDERSTDSELQELVYSHKRWNWRGRVQQTMKYIGIHSSRARMSDL
ncbi:hypothetical protein PQX77_018255 [Marasmius sp. AFHP31]|nr:hypothetical protein PQX77_018255 [Marasmius sp. AFHP31]